MRKTQLGLIPAMSLAFIPIGNIQAETLLLDESSVPCVEAQIAQLTYGQHTTGCSVSDAVDSDIFQFPGSAGDNALIYVRGHTDNFDPRVRVRDPGGAVLADKVCDGNNGGCSVAVALTMGSSDGGPLPTDGTYQITISDSGANETGSYTVQVEKSPPPVEPLRVSFPYDRTVTGGISPVTDVDFMTFSGAAGTEIELTMRSTTDNYDVYVRLRDPAGTLIDIYSCDGNNGGCSIVAPIVLQESGYYLLEVLDSGLNESGNYQISVQCAFGACPMDLDGDTVVDAMDNCLRVPNPGQQDVDEDGIGNYCDGDLDNDCTVNFVDLGEMKAVFFSGDPEADLNSDGAVNFIDLGVMGADFFAKPGPATLPNLCNN